MKSWLLIMEGRGAEAGESMVGARSGSAGVVKQGVWPAIADV